MRGNPTFQEVEVVILALPASAPSPEQLEVLCSALAAFAAANDNPATSSHLKATVPDRLDSLLLLLSRPEVQKSTDACVLVLKCLKILARRQDNRGRCGSHTFQALLPFCNPKQQPAVASEAANVLLNLAYEARNVQTLVRCKGEASLLQLLAAGHPDVLANAAGAVQTVCYQREGREAVRRAGGVAILVKALQRTDSVKVRQRTAGAIHNLSSEAEAVRMLREQGGIAALAGLLRSPDSATAAAAVGALQNCAREVASAQALRAQEGAVEALAALLLSQDVQIAACAAGVLLQLHQTKGGSAASSEVVSLAKGLAGAISAAAIYSSLYSEGPSIQLAAPT